MKKASMRSVPVAETNFQLKRSNWQCKSNETNDIHTTKYTFYNFLPKFLYEQFSEFANLFFLAVTAIQFCPKFNFFGAQGTSMPLATIIIFAMFKECWEDHKRRKNNRLENRQTTRTYTEGRWKDVTWGELHVGQLVQVIKDSCFPADLVLISSSEPAGLAYIETSNLDGETNLKIRRSHPLTANAVSNEEVLNLLLEASVFMEEPSKDLYEFDGFLHISKAALALVKKSASQKSLLDEVSRFNSEQGIPLDKSQFLPRGARLKNTESLFGIVVYVGRETKFMLNSVKTKHKKSRSSRLLNFVLMVQFGLLLISSAVYSFLSRHDEKALFMRFVSISKEEDLFTTAMSYIIMLAAFVPISLYITVETIQLTHASFIRSDMEMYDQATDTHAEVRTSTLSSQLGEVSYIMADKTGTLTRNLMLFKNCSVGGVKYGSKHRQQFNPKIILSDLKTNQRDNAEELAHFLTACSVCHTVVPEKTTEDVVYHASSPDEHALVTFARNAGFIFHSRTPDLVQVTEKMSDSTVERVHTLLYVIEFDSIRKMMGVVVISEGGLIRLYVKGADSAVFSVLSSKQTTKVNRLKKHLGEFARRGMRTLCFAYREVTESEFNSWKESIQGALAADQKEKARLLQESELALIHNLTLIGASAIEDKLQERVPETIERILNVGIRFWVLTGDKLETAINIGYSCRLLSANLSLLILSATSAEEIQILLRNWIEQLGPRLRHQTAIAIIVDSPALEQVLMSEDMKTDFMQLALAAASVICCRCTPFQKASVTKLARDFACGCVLAIGDGGNDIAMIQESDVGVGICGREGMQAAMTADFSIVEFQHLDRLLFVHGVLSLFRQNKTILYTLYKNILEACVMGFYTALAGHSFQVYTDEMHIILYNIVYTCLPPLVLGIFDRPAPIDYLTKDTSCYRMHQKSFSIKSYLGWALLAFYHAVVIFSGTFAFECDGASYWPNGRESFLQIYGFTMFYSFTCVVNSKALLETSSITAMSLASLGLSLSAPLIWVFYQSFSFPLMPISRTSLIGLGWNIPLPGFILFILVMISITLLPDFVAKVITRTLEENEMTLADQSRLIGARVLDPLLKVADMGDLLCAYDSRPMKQTKEEGTPTDTRNAQGDAPTDTRNAQGDTHNSKEDKTVEPDSPSQRGVPSVND